MESQRGTGHVDLGRALSEMFRKNAKMMWSPEFRRSRCINHQESNRMNEVEGNIILDYGKKNFAEWPRGEVNSRTGDEGGGGGLGPTGRRGGNVPEGESLSG